MVVAPASITASTTCARKSSSVREASSGENSTSLAVLARDLHALDRAADDLLLRHVELVLAMDRAGGQEHVQAVARGVGASARAASSMSSRVQRASPAMIGPCTSRATALTASQSPREAAGKPASITSTPSSRERARHPQLLRLRHAAAGGLLAVAQGGVEDQDSVGSLSVS